MKRYFTLLLVLLADIALQAQDFNIPVFRGELAQRYNYQLEGTVYAYSDEFQEGTLEFNGKHYSGLMMNLNAHRNELQVRIGTTGESIAVKRSLVGDFTIGKRNFTALYGERGIKGLAEGYYQVLYRGKDMLLKEIYKSTNDRTDYVNNITVKVFTTRTRYWLVKDGKVTGIRDGNDLAGIYREHKDEVKRYLKGHKGEEKDVSLQTIMELIEEGR